MPVLFQNVRNIFSEVKSQFSPYLQGLLFHKNRKTCSSMARNLCVPLKQLYNSFKEAKSKAAAIRSNLQMIANSVESAGEMRVLAIDGTMIRKAVATKIHNLAFDYDGVLRRATQGLSIIVGSLLIGGNVFPLDFLFWKNSKKKNKKKKSKDPNYKTKIMLAIEFILSVKDIILFDYLAMDGAFASEKMISFLELKKLKYSMRIPRSRRVLIDGVLMKLSEHKALRLVKNERCKTAAGSYKGHPCFFTVEKRKNKKGKWDLRYIVSNMDLSAKGHVKAYARRWPIDKSFRSMKQYLGLTDCQMCSEIKQVFHIFNVFLAYSIATLKKIASGKNTVEDILNEWRKQEFSKKSQILVNNNDLDDI